MQEIGIQVLFQGESQHTIYAWMNNKPLGKSVYICGASLTVFEINKYKIDQSCIIGACRFWILFKAGDLVHQSEMLHNYELAIVNI